MPSIINATTTNGLSTSADNSGSLQLATNNGTTAVTIDTSQNVGIGTSSPQSWATYAALEINKGSGGYVVNNASGGFTAFGQNLYFNSGYKYANSAPASLYYQQGGAHVWQTASSGTAGNAITLTDRMTITSGGVLCINTTNFIANSSERLTVTSSGDTSFFQCTGGGNAGTAIHVNRNGGTGNLLYFSYGGGFSAIGSISTNGTTTSYNTSSDYRLKENIAPMTGALAKVAQLKPVTYTWKTDGFSGQGFIAHELQAVAPECVTGEKDAVDAEGNPVYQGVDTSFLVATLTSAIQELNTDLANTKLLLTEVSNKVEAQAVRIAELEGAK